MKKLCVFLVLSLGLAFGSSNAEIVTNSKGEKIELKPNGTWKKVKIDADAVAVVGTHTINVKDGNDKKIPIKVHYKIEGESTKKLTQQDLASYVDLTGFKVMLKLKNKYSFVPKTAMATLKGDSLEVFMEYIGKNSYGAEVVGHELSKFELSK